MRRRSGSDRIGIKKKPWASAAKEEIGSRVFPLPAAAAAPMPAVGTRRSTRVFVPKAAKPHSAVGPAPARVLRSGKRLTFPDLPTDNSRDDDDGGVHWLQWTRDDAKNGFHVEEEEQEAKPQIAAWSVDSPAPTRYLGIVYNRKRRKQASGQSELTDQRRFGIVFTRKEKRAKTVHFGHENLEELSATPGLLSTELAARTGFLEDDFLTFAGGSSSCSNVTVFVFAALVDMWCPGSSHLLSRFLVPVLRWIRHSPQAKFQQLAWFLLSSGIAGVFAMHGVHFLALRRRKAGALMSNALVPCGLCEIHRSTKLVLLLSVNFSALCSYFQSLHLQITLDSMYLPSVIRRSMHRVGGEEEMYSCVLLEADSILPSSVDSMPAEVLESNGPSRVVQDYTPLEQVAGLVVHGLRLKKHQRKRSSSRHHLNRQRLSVRFINGTVEMKQGVSSSQLDVRPPLSLQEPVTEPVCPKAALEISLDLLDNMDDSDVSTPVGSNGKQKRSALKSPVERLNERTALAEVRQNIDSVRCKANILIIQVDKCLREEGAEVMLELSDSNEWCISVKMHDTTRISHKPSELKCCVVNRFTHAYMWGVDEGWKLEFIEKWDWLLFKELHVEGRERNSQGKVIPIPGVTEVFDDMEQILAYPFVRPVPDYIKMLDDEVGRALTKDSIYDMDSEDEEWLSQLNPVCSDEKCCHLNCVSPEDFEKIITTFEKDAYNNPEETNDVDRLLSHYQGLGKDAVLAVYEYWINKRNKKGVPLLKIFQSAPLRRAQLSQKPSFKKKRSFKRQRSQAGRGKPEAILQDSADEEALRRVQEAERAAKQAVETAIQLRSRAQALMANAEIATYKSVMAVRLADAARLSDSSLDLASSILD